MRLVRAGLVAAGLIHIAGDLQGQTFVTSRGGNTMVTEKVTGTADSAVSTTTFEGQMVEIRTRRVKTAAGQTVDMEAIANGERQKAHVELGASSARFQFEAGSMKIDSVVSLPPDRPTIIYYNLVFSLLQPLGPLRPAVGASPRAINVLMANNAALESWQLQSVAPDTAELTTMRGLKILLTFRDGALMGVRVPTQGVEVIVK